MNIEERREGAVTVVRPQGPLVLGDAEQFKAAVDDVMTRSLGRFVIDASAVPYLDSRGLETLAEISETLSQRGGVLRLCGANDTLREVFDLTDTSPLFEHFADVNAGVRSFL
ncbi:MAG: STAS domain-containing protein [Phycisphaeraceae bacterium]|nr:MAG: STAS domain-containing protein [Phycisphaeraceae bacterium]